MERFSLRTFLADGLVFLANTLKPSYQEEAPGIGIYSDGYGDENPSTIAQNEGLSYYYKMVQDDPMLRAGLQHRNTSYLFQSATGIPETEQYEAVDPQLIAINEEPNGRDIWSFVANNLDNQIERGFRNVLEQMQFSGDVFGYSIQEIMWAEAGGKIYAADVKDRDPERFKLLWEIHPVSKLPQIVIYKRVSAFSEDVIPLSPHKFFAHIPCMRLENPFGESILRSLVNVCYGKKNVKLFFERDLERFGSPLMSIAYKDTGQYAKDATKRQALVNEYVRLRSQGIIAHPESQTVDLIGGESADASFISYLEYADKMISIALTGNSMSIVQPSVGSYALAKSTTEVANSEYEFYITNKLQDTVNQYLIPWLVDWNFANVTRYPYVQLISPQIVKPAVAESVERGQEDKESQEPKKEEQQEEEREQQQYTIYTADKDFRYLDTFEITRPTQDDIAYMEEWQERYQEWFAFETELHNLQSYNLPFPDPEPAPREYENPEVIQGAIDYMRSQPIVNRRAFNKLSPQEKKFTFTITGVLNLDVIQQLHAAIERTLPITNEKDAWTQYLAEAKRILKANNMLASRAFQVLPISFRIVRQQAYMAGIMQFATAHVNDVFGLQYNTKDDPRVRVNHQKMHLVLRPVNEWLHDIFLQSWIPPNGFSCRCWLRIVSLIQAETEQLEYTVELPKAIPDKGWGNV